VVESACATESGEGARCGCQTTGRPASANEMKRRLGLPYVEPRDGWPQGELF
jgi:hypothetical protein